MSDSPRILAVDDQPEMRRLLRRLLRHDGYDLHEAASGDEAIALARSLAPALILLDCEMPGLDGASVLGTLRAEGYRAPVVMLSAHMDATLAAKLEQRGATACLWKLKLARELAPTVARLVGRADA